MLTSNLERGFGNPCFRIKILSPSIAPVKPSAADRSGPPSGFFVVAPDWGPITVSRMKYPTRIGVSVVATGLLLLGCDRHGGFDPTLAGKTLEEARQGFQTTLTRKESDGTSVPQPPPELFRTVSLQFSPGELAR